MKEKIFKFNKNFITVLFLLLSGSLIFWERTNSVIFENFKLIYVISVIIFIMICTNSRFYTFDSFFEQKLISRKSFQLSEIDRVVFRKLLLDFVVYLKNGKKVTLNFVFNGNDKEDFINYLEKNGIEVIKK